MSMHMQKNGVGFLYIKVLVTQLCLSDCSLPGSCVHEFPRQEYLSRLPFPSPGDLPDPGIKPVSPALAGRLLISHYI